MSVLICGLTEGGLSLIAQPHTCSLAFYCEVSPVTTSIEQRWNPKLFYPTLHTSGLREAYLRKSGR
jgi:hypothetical protein